MPVIADYRILTDSAITMDAGSERESIFNPPNDIYLTNEWSERPVVCYSMQALSGTPRLRVYLQRNQSTEEVFTHTLTDGSMTTLMEPITSTLLTTGDNRIRFEVTGGRLVLQNVIVFFQRDI